MLKNISLLGSLMLFVLLSLVSCEKEPNKPKTLYEVQGGVSVLVQGEQGFGRHPVTDAVVMLGDRFDTTNSNGEYHFSNIQEGSYFFLVGHPWTKGYVSSIEIPIPLSAQEWLMKFDVALEPNDIVEEYFPLKVGLVWEYAYRTLESRPNEYVWTVDGNRIWQIVEAIEEDGYIRYRVKDSMSGVKINYVTGAGYDTTKIGPLTNYFNIDDFDDGQMRMNFLFRPWEQWEVKVTIPRYNTPFAKDELEFYPRFSYGDHELPYGGYIYFKKKIGMSRYTCNIGSHWHRGVGQKLIAFSGTP